MTGRNLSILLSLMLTACSSVGNDRVRLETMDTVDLKVVRGQTTKAQVQSLYGEPGWVTLTDAGETWTYAYQHSGLKFFEDYRPVDLLVAAHSLKKKELVFYFDRKGRLQNFALHTSRATERLTIDDIDRP